jgi:hypothetical protein
VLAPGTVGSALFNEPLDVSLEVPNRPTETDKPRPLRVQPPRAQRGHRQAQPAGHFMFRQSSGLIAIHTTLLGDWVLQSHPFVWLF